MKNAWRRPNNNNNDDDDVDNVSRQTDREYFIDGNWWERIVRNGWMRMPTAAPRKQKRFTVAMARLLSRTLVSRQRKSRKANGKLGKGAACDSMFDYTRMFLAGMRQHDSVTAANVDPASKAIHFNRKLVVRSLSMTARRVCCGNGETCIRKVVAFKLKQHSSDERQPLRCWLWWCESLLMIQLLFEYPEYKLS